MATFPLPPNHPYEKLRPGNSNILFENPPTPAIVNVSLSYLGITNTIFLSLYANCGGNWTVTTPGGLSVIINPLGNSSQTLASYSGGSIGNTYTFNTIQFVKSGATSTVSWTGTPPSIRL